MKKLFQISALFVAMLFASLTSFAHPHPEKGTLFATSFPLGANVTVDGVAPRIPDTPTIVRLAPGLHTVVFAANEPGWVSQTVIISIISDHLTSIDVTLLPALSSGLTVYTKNTGGPPVAVDEIFSVIDPGASVISTTVPTGQAYLLTAKTIANVSIFSTNEPEFNCVLSKTSDSWVSFFQVRNDGSDHGFIISLQGVTDFIPVSFGPTITLSLSCANEAHIVYPVGGLRFFNSVITAIPVGTVNRQ